MKVLIVDDEESIRDYFKNFLERLGYSVILSSNGREALERLGEEEVHVIFSDLLMPEMDGMTLLKNIKDTENLKHIPVILLTGHGDSESISRARELGVFDYLEKPVRIKNIISLIEAIREK